MQQCLTRRLFSATVLRRHPPAQRRFPIFIRNSSSSFGSNTVDGDDDWNDAWETAWLPDKLDGKNRVPWEADVNFPDSHSCGSIVLPSDADPDTKAFVEEMDERWDERRMAAASSSRKQKDINGDLGPLRKNKEDEDYRLKKQKIHAGLWMKEIEKMEESRLADPDGTGTVEAADIDRLLDSCSEIFDSSHDELNNKKIPSISNVKAKPDGWESTSKTPDGNIWEVTQREEDILLQEFERRIAFSKFQIASFIKTHIFSRRRPIDGWKYMIEELGPNARKGKGTVQRVPSLADSSTQPFKDDGTSNVSNFGAYKRR